MMQTKDIPRAGIWCKDERFSRLLEIQLGLCGVEGCYHLCNDPDQAPTCLVWLVDFDDFPYETLPQRSDGCMVYGWSKSHEVCRDLEGVVRYCFHRPFSMTAFESALCEDLYGVGYVLPHPVYLRKGSADSSQPPLDPRRWTEQPLRIVAEGEVVVGDVRVTLTKQEWALFACLWERRGQLTPKHILWEAMRATDSGEPPTTNTLEVYICHLRRKLEKPTGRRLIDTKRGVGYVLVER